MPYEEVRSALLVGKFTANEAVKYIHALNIMEVHQMDGPAARRFPNIEEVNCFSLLSVDELTEERLICAKTATRLVPFLVTIPNFKRVSAGGWSEQMTRLIFDRDDFSYDVGEKDTTIFGCLVRAFLGALQGRLFPHLERISGITEALNSTEDLCEEKKEICSFCRDVCTYFPVQDLLENVNLELIGHCGGEDPVKIYELIASKKPNSKVIFKAASERPLCEFTLGTYWRHWYITDDEIKGYKLLEKVRAQLQMSTVDSEISFNSFRYMSIPISYLNKTGLSALDRMIALGFDPRVITKERISSRIGIGNSLTMGVITKSTVDALSARGFQLDPKDLIVLNEKTEPALKDKLPDVIKEEDD